MPGKFFFWKILNITGKKPENISRKIRKNRIKPGQRFRAGESPARQLPLTGLL